MSARGYRLLCVLPAESRPSIHTVQLVGVPLYLIHEDYFYAYMAITKQFFGIVTVCITEWFSPTVIRMSGDASVKGQLRLTKNGRLESDFPERLIMIANHQVSDAGM